MIKKIGIVPKWIVLLIDTTFSLVSLFLANSFLGVNLSKFSAISIAVSLLLFLVTNLIVFTSLKLQSGIIRYTGLQDAIKVLFSIVIISTTISLIKVVLGNEYSLYFLNFKVLFLYTAFALIILVSYRGAFRHLFFLNGGKNKRKKNVVIFGAGNAGFATQKVLENDSQNNFNLIAFVDDDISKNKKVLNGIPILSFLDLIGLVRNTEIDQLIIASFSISVERKNEIVNFCIDNAISILRIPSIEKWDEGKFNSRQLQTIKIEDLLERAPIIIDNFKISNQIDNKRVLVTGAAGSIGSEIVRQLLKFCPQLVIMCDQSETPLHNLELELESTERSIKLIPFLADITDESRMEYLFQLYNPQYVYHAAAYKHVPMMEAFPREAIKNNVLGTKVVSDLATKYKSERFVMVSTDKAVNPTNVMGASKRLAEMYVQSVGNEIDNQTKFIITRFGNVLGSNGSVINRFKEQIEKGGPLTVTHPDITRFFMTIPEACQLVLEAASMGNGGEIFVFDMGSPVKISELAKKMIKLYGFIPDVDVEIIYTGLRPGEKLYEELLSVTESTIKTYHNKILIAKVRDISNEGIKNRFNDFKYLLSTSAPEIDIVMLMKELVPEFVSNNSVFEKLDNKKNDL